MSSGAPFVSGVAAFACQKISVTATLVAFVPDIAAFVWYNASLHLE